MAIFGRKGLTPAAPPPPSPEPSAERPGHDHVLAHLRDFDTTDPLARPSLAGRVLFDLVYQIIHDDRGARAEDLLAILASTGGFACILAAFEEARENGATPQGMGMVLVEAKDRQRYWFGDLPNRYLLESEHAVLSHALGAVQQFGGVVPMAMVEDAMRRVAGNVGGPGFGVPNVSALHMPGDAPINYVRFLWPKLVETLDLYQVPIRQRPSALGFALRAAIGDLADPGPSPIDMLTVAQIVIECAVPMAKLDPARFGF